MAPKDSSRRQTKSKSSNQTPQPELGGQFIPEDAWLQIRTDLRLSDRELRIVQGVWNGQEQEGIALSLGVTFFVVYRSLQRIYIKLHIGSRLELKSHVWASYMVYLAQHTPPGVVYGAGAA
jgi:DNA-binding NarL/FixJ family response regulator